MIAEALEGLVAGGAELTDGLVRHRDPRSALHLSGTQGPRAWRWLNEIPESTPAPFGTMASHTGRTMRSIDPTAGPLPTKRPALTADTFSPKSVLSAGMGMSALPTYDDAIGAVSGAGKRKFSNALAGFSKKMPHVQTIGLLANTATNIVQTVHIKDEKKEIAALAKKPMVAPSRTFYVQ